MAALLDVLNSLLAFLGKSMKLPESRGFKFFELADGKVDERGKIVVRRADLHAPDEFEARFLELSTQGPPWINVSCYGLFEGNLIVGIEVPRPSSSGSNRTSVNYSGPPKIVREGGWDATCILLIE